jgi:galactokinase
MESNAARAERLSKGLAAHWPDASRGDAAIVRAPGRVNLIGDHTDYNDGYVLPAAIGLETWIALRPRSDGRIRVASEQVGGTASYLIADLAPAQDRRTGEGHWADYVAGTAWSLREAGLPVAGFDGLVDSTIPVGAGLSSSAALELASAIALLPRDSLVNAGALAAMAQRAEREYVGVDCGIMDQFASAAGHEGKALLLDCRSLETRHVPLPAGIGVVVCDTGTRRELRNSAYNTRRAECARAVALLAEVLPGLGSLRDLTPEDLGRFRNRLPEVVARRAEHVVGENLRVTAAVAALRAGDLDELGLLFARSHASLRDLYEVGAPALDAMVDLARSVPGVVAARMTGAGFGGCTVNLVRDDAVERLVAAVRPPATAYAVAIVDGAGPLTSRL